MTVGAGYEVASVGVRLEAGVSVTVIEMSPPRLDSTHGVASRVRADVVRLSNRQPGVAASPSLPDRRVAFEINP